MIHYSGAGKTIKAGMDLRWTQYSTQNSGQIVTFSAADTFAAVTRGRRVERIWPGELAVGMPTSGNVNINIYPTTCSVLLALAAIRLEAAQQPDGESRMRWDANLRPSSATTA